MSLDYNFHKCSNSDKIVSRFIIANLIKMQINRKIFSDKDSADKYLESIRNEQFDINMSRLDNIEAEKHLYNRTEFLWFNGSDSKKLVLYFYGSAFVHHIIGLHIKMIDSFRNVSGDNVLAPLYLTAPDYTWKESIDDIFGIYKYAAEKIGSENIVLMGDSTGGTIALTLLTTLKERGISFPGKIILLSPMTDISCSNLKIKSMTSSDPLFCGIDGLKEFIKAWAGDTPLDSPYINPMHIDMTDMPETHMYIGSRDIFCPDAIAFYKKARANDVDISLGVYDKMAHFFTLYPLKSSKEIQGDIAAIIGRRE